MKAPDIFDRKHAAHAAHATSQRPQVARCNSRHTADNAANAQAVKARSEVIRPPCASNAGLKTANPSASPPAARPNSPRAHRHVSQQANTPKSPIASRPRWSIAAKGLPSWWKKISPMRLALEPSQAGWSSGGNFSSIPSNGNAATRIGSVPFSGWMR